MLCCFGEVITGAGSTQPLIEPKMVLNEIGIIANEQWLWLEKQYEYVVLHEFIVMPNHMHGIIEINTVEICRDMSDTGTGHDLSLHKIKSLSELIGAYKTTTSKKIHLSGHTEFSLQRSFYDHIIRNEKSYEKISQYILANPNVWEKDKFFVKK